MIIAALSSLGLKAQSKSLMTVVDGYFHLEQDAIHQCVHDPAIAGSDLVISLGGAPVSIYYHGAPLFELVGKRFFIYSLDPVIYDYSLHNIPEFLEKAKNSERLAMMAPDRDWCNLVNGLSSEREICTYQPFAGIYNPLLTEQRLPRVAVIGTIGGELASVSDEKGFEDFVNQAPSSNVETGRLKDFAQRVQMPGSPANVTCLAQDYFGLTAAEVLTPEWASYLGKLDSFQKRRRRKLAVSEMKNLPVDFFGYGWERYTDGFKDARHMGVASYYDIPKICQEYSAILNFDPNWDHGLHDRVFTALGSGCRVLTNRSSALGEIDLPADDAVFTYDANQPHGLADQATYALSLPQMPLDAVQRFRQENSWLNRMDRFLMKALGSAPARVF